MSPQRHDRHWRCECGAGHFLTIVWDPDEKPRVDAQVEGYLSLEGAFRPSWLARIAEAWRVLTSSHSGTRVGVILDAAKAREIAAVLSDFADDASAGPSPEIEAGEPLVFWEKAKAALTDRGIELTREEGRKMLDDRTRSQLGMPLEEFERRYDAGTLPDTPEVEHLVMLLPFAREQLPPEIEAVIEEGRRHPERSRPRRERRSRQLWDEAAERADPAKVARMLAHVDEQAARIEADPEFRARRWRTWEEVEAQAKTEGRLDEAKVTAEQERLRGRLRLSDLPTADEIHERNMRDDPEYRAAWEQQEAEDGEVFAEIENALPWVRHLPEAERRQFLITVLTWKETADYHALAASETTEEAEEHRRILRRRPPQADKDGEP